MSRADRHHNLFYYYRGPSVATEKGREDGAIDAHKQIEDNTTKALINLLEHSDPELTTSFSARFVPGSAAGAPLGSGYTYFLQEGPNAAEENERWLLGISVLGEIDAPPWVAAETGSRIDAAILQPGAALIAIEVKVVEKLDGAQLIRHAKRWGIPESSDGNPPPEWICARWADVFGWAAQELEADYGDSTRLLLAQFTEYLEIIGLAPFTGFRREDFEFFEEPEHAPHRLVEVKARLAGLWEAVIEELEPEEVRSLGEIRVGTMKSHDDHSWATTNWGEGGVNLTCELRAENLTLNVVGWTEQQRRRIEDWLASPAAAPSLSGLHGFELVVFKRRAMRAGSGKPFWMQGTSKVIDTVRADELCDGSLPRRLSAWGGALEPGWEKLAYHLRCTWEREKVVRNPAVVPEIADVVKHLIPILAEINHSRSRPRSRATADTSRGPFPISRCPSCGSPRILPVVWGMPSGELEREAQEGRVVLGGCLVYGDDRDPDRQCLECGQRWRASPAGEEASTTS